MPEKSKDALRTIGEAAKEVGVEPHVLRFWEKKFKQIDPVKRGSGRRYYRAEDISFLIKLRTLLHDEGFTIKGAQKYLKTSQDLPHLSDAPQDRDINIQPITDSQEQSLKRVLSTLKSLRDDLQTTLSRI